VGRSKKGAGFERQMCKELSLWWSNGNRDDIFWRTAGSGARATSRKKKGLRTADGYGDVMSSHESGKPLTKKVVISLKRGYTGKKAKKKLAWISVLDILDTPHKFKTEPALKVWWRELLRDMRAGKRKRGLLIFRRDRKDAVVVMSEKTFRMIDKRKKYMFPNFGPYCWVQLRGFHVYMMRLDHFFEWCEPEFFGAARKIKRRPKKRKLKRRK
jgi:hypothetical protein